MKIQVFFKYNQIYIHVDVFVICNNFRTIKLTIRT